MKWFVATALVFIMTITGCATLQKAAPTGPCVGPAYYVGRDGQAKTLEDPSTSTLCRMLPDPMYTKMGLFLANDAALRAKLYNSDDAIDFIERVRDSINLPGATVKTVVLSTLTELEEVKKVAPELFIAAQWLEDPRYQVDDPIDDYTWYRLNKFLNEQRALVLLFK